MSNVIRVTFNMSQLMGKFNFGIEKTLERMTFCGRYSVCASEGGKFLCFVKLSCVSIELHKVCINHTQKEFCEYLFLSSRKHAHKVGSF